MKRWLLLAAAPAGLVLLLGAAFSSEAEQAAASSVDAGALPPLARKLLPEIEDLRSSTCPELPLVWLLAEVEAESSWNPRAHSNAGAAGLLQLLPGSWSEATGEPGWDVGSGPGAHHAVWQPMPHLRVAVPWTCGHLRAMTVHLRAEHKAASPLDAMAVCHIAGCSRVTGSRTGIPSAGEAGCGRGCATQISDYLAAIHHWVGVYSTSTVHRSEPAGPAQPFPGNSSGCTIPDPTGTGGCVTAVTAWMLAQAQRTYPGIPVSCWDAHAWNLTSDHPLGKACDFTIGHLGKFPEQPDVARGWSLATWARANSRALHVSYVIWQGRIWSVSRDAEGWRPYTGGGIYDPSDATGGHYDHVHISMAE